MSEPTQTILLVDSDEDYLSWAKRHLSFPGKVEVWTTTDAVAAVQRVQEEKPDLIITELLVAPFTGLELLRRIRQHDPNAMVILTTAFPPTSAVIEAMKLGAYDFLRKESLTFDLRPMVEGALRAQEEIQQANRSARPESPDSEQQRETIIGSSSAMQEVFKMIGRVSRADAPVLITGESGAGKEIVARAIHKFSHRANREYVAINCAAIPNDLLESELFGHEKGAFTGATNQRTGRFEQCDGGTLFLDEIGDMPVQVQSKILRVLQEGEFSRVGGNQTLRSDVRILAATNKDLEEAVEKGWFREDLFYRLNVVRIQIPPLRDRRDDVRLLAEFFLKRAAENRGGPKYRVSDEAMRMLENYDWPGNVRELENTLQRACVLATNNVLLPRDIPLGRVPRRTEAVPLPDRAAEPAPAARAAVISPEEISAEVAIEALLNAAADNPEGMQLLPWLEREMVQHAMKRVGGNQVRAAKLLGITRGTLRKRLERFDIGG